MDTQPPRKTKAQVEAQNDRDATKMVYILGASLTLSITTMSLAWIIPALYA